MKLIYTNLYGFGNLNLCNKFFSLAHGNHETRTLLCIICFCFLFNLQIKIYTNFLFSRFSKPLIHIYII